MWWLRVVKSRSSSKILLDSTMTSLAQVKSHSLSNIWLRIYGYFRLTTGIRAWSQHLIHAYHTTQLCGWHIRGNHSRKAVSRYVFASRASHVPRLTSHSWLGLDL